MTDPVFEGPPVRQWAWIFGVALVVVAAIFWLGGALDTDHSASSAQPVGRSTEWAPEPTGPAVPVNLPKTPMTNAPDKAS